LLFQSSLVVALDVVTFGDSLTHNDLLGWYFGNPQDLYGNDPMQAAFNKAARSGDSLRNYAVAGSESQQVNVQINFYDLQRLLGNQRRANLIGYEIGGNDILNNIDLLARFGVGESPAADGVINQLLSNQMNQLSHLASTHPGGRAVLWNIPDVTYTPELFGSLTTQEIANVRAHIQRANEFINGLSSLPNVVVVDVYTMLGETVVNPPVIFGSPLVPPPAFGNYDHIFADSIHPTAVANAIIANEIIEAVNTKWGLNIPLYTEQELADLARIPST
jgi:phospholipase/lecithinase/hemolysin